MDDADGVRGVERVADLRGDVGNALRRQRPITDSVDRRSLDEFHNEESRRLVGVDCRGFADVVQRADMRMVQRRDGPRFALEPLAGPRVGATCAGSTLMATVRWSRVSCAL